MFRCSNVGPNYLRRICQARDGGEPVKILSTSEVSLHFEENKEVNSWMGSVKEYLMDVNGELIHEKELVFFIESQIFLTNTNPQRAISVMVSIYLQITTHKSNEYIVICKLKIHTQ